MPEFPQATEDSKELRALALRFFAFNKKYRTERTEKYMELSGKLKDLTDEIDEMMKIMQSGEPFNKIPGETSAYYSKNPVIQVRAALNKYSMAKLHKTICDVAVRFAAWNSKTRRKPHAEAAAWVAYFAEWDQEAESYGPNDNWVQYYNEYYLSIPRTRRKKTK